MAEEKGPHIRPMWKSTIEEALPYDAKVLMQAYRMIRGGLPELYLNIPIMPPSVNKLYAKWVNPKTGKIVNATDRQVTDYRRMAEVACAMKTFRARSSIGVVLAFESAGWMTLERRVKKRDVDNPVKVTLDALTRCLPGFRDECVWSCFETKICSRLEATHIWLFDLGEVVSAVGGQEQKALL